MRRVLLGGVTTFGFTAGLVLVMFVRGATTPDIPDTRLRLVQ